MGGPLLVRVPPQGLVLRFSSAVPCSRIIGDGRFCGLCLMIPAAEQAVP